MYPKIAFGCWIAKSRRRRQPSSQSLKYVIWTRASTSDRERWPHRQAVRIMVRLMGLPTRQTNSSHASSSRGPAQRQTRSFSDKDEYRIGLWSNNLYPSLSQCAANAAQTVHSEPNAL